MKIGDAANVFRCSLEKEEADGDGSPILWKRHGLDIWNEVRVENIDPLTGFISPPFLSVRLDKEPDRDAIKTTDTMLCFLGTIERIRRPGMLIFEWACVPARNLAIIRPRKIDPVWLYYSTYAALKKVEPENRGGRGFLGIERIREIELGEYREEAVERIIRAHKVVENYYKKYLNAAMRIEARVGKI